MANTSTRQTLGATRARQGRYGAHVIWVLVFGLLLAVLGVFAAWTWKSGDLASTAPSSATRQADARGFASPRPSDTTRQNYQAGAPLAPKNGGNPQNPS